MTAHLHDSDTWDFLLLLAISDLAEDYTRREEENGDALWKSWFFVHAEHKLFTCFCHLKIQRFCPIHNETEERRNGTPRWDREIISLDEIEVNTFSKVTRIWR